MEVVEIISAAIVSGIIVFLVAKGYYAGFFAKKIKTAFDEGFEKGEAERIAKAEALIGSAEKEAERLVEDAKRSAETILREADDHLKIAEKDANIILKDAEAAKKLAIVNAKDDIHKERQEAERELKERRVELSKQERRIQQKEEQIDRKLDNTEKKEELVTKKLKEADNKILEAEEVKVAQINMLQKISELTIDQAKAQLLNILDQELEHEKAIKISQHEQDFKINVDQKACNLMSLAMAKCASEHITEAAVSVVSLPSDEMKGRIIGREGRNIRTLESLTGCDLIIDDTPEAITVSCFDPVRREVARITLEKLIVDGRIHPARIEEMVDKARREVETRIRQEGERAVLEANIRGLNHEMVTLLGRMTYRTSYRQNVLNHSIETALLAGVLAAELGVDPALARRAGLLHDIGKALTSEQEGSHVTLGVQVCKKAKELPDIIHAIEAHHNDVEPRTALACIIQAADALSAARPGARSENYESYIKRLQQLEATATGFDGVSSAYCIQAGREIRVMLIPDKISDDKMKILARDIANKIENDLTYPGQVKVQLIRETRITEIAK